VGALPAVNDPHAAGILVVRLQIHFGISHDIRRPLGHDQPIDGRLMDT
jgi:hypothetical protein